MPVAGSQTHHNISALPITLWSAHGKSPVPRSISHFCITHCYYFNIKEKDRGEVGKQTYGLAAIVFFFWLPPFHLRLSLKPASSPTSEPHQSPAMQTGRMGLPLDRIFWKDIWKNRMLFASWVAQSIAARPTV